MVEVEKLFFGFAFGLVVTIYAPCTFAAGEGFQLEKAQNTSDSKSKIFEKLCPPELPPGNKRCSQDVPKARRQCRLHTYTTHPRYGARQTQVMAASMGQLCENSARLPPL